MSQSKTLTLGGPTAIFVPTTASRSNTLGQNHPFSSKDPRPLRPGYGSYRLGVYWHSQGQFLYSLAERLLQFVEEYEYLAIFSLLFLEEAGVPLPLPGDSIMLLSGYLVHEGRANALLSLLSMEAATVGGASVLYWISHFVGRPLLLRYGRLIGLNQSRMIKTEDWLRRHGAIGILVGRLVPGLRIPTSIASGALRLPFRTFLPYMALGSSLYILAFFILGLVLGKETPGLLRILHTLPVTPLVLFIAAVVIVITVLLVLLRFRRPGST